jgi:hypothetical protein
MPFVEKGTDLGESCALGLWTAERQIDVFDQPPPSVIPSPFAPRLTAPIQPAETVTAIDGWVLVTEPGRARIEKSMNVLVKHPNFPAKRTVALLPNDLVYLLRYYGNGEFLAWFKKDLIIVETGGFEGGGCPSCARTGAILSWPRADTWVHIRTVDRREGWVKGRSGFQCPS